MQNFCSINPMWFILAVNVIAAFLVPFLTYRYTHKNNVKTLREKWMSELRSAVSAYIESTTNLYYANDTRYQKLTSMSHTVDSERGQYIKRSEEAQAKVTAAWTRIRLMFKDGDADFVRLEPLLEALRKSVDEPKKTDFGIVMDHKSWVSAQDLFLKESNSILASVWTKITE